jgi:hypothetical protein
VNRPPATGAPAAPPSPLPTTPGSDIEHRHQGAASLTTGDVGDLAIDRRWAPRQRRGAHPVRYRRCGLSRSWCTPSSAVPGASLSAVTAICPTQGGSPPTAIAGNDRSHADDDPHPDDLGAAGLSRRRTRCGTGYLLAGSQQVTPMVCARGSKQSLARSADNASPSRRSGAGCAVRLPHVLGQLR